MLLVYLLFVLVINTSFFMWEYRRDRIDRRILTASIIVALTVITLHITRADIKGMMSQETFVDLCVLIVINTLLYLLMKWRIRRMNIHKIRSEAAKAFGISLFTWMFLRIAPSLLIILQLIIVFFGPR